jgi:hypothetical protein
MPSFHSSYGIIPRYKANRKTSLPKNQASTLPFHKTTQLNP